VLNYYWKILEKVRRGGGFGNEKREKRVFSTP
jgi:hypothetical protein